MLAPTPDEQSGACPFRCSPICCNGINISVRASRARVGWCLEMCWKITSVMIYFSMNLHIESWFVYYFCVVLLFPMSKCPQVLWKSCAIELGESRVVRYPYWNLGWVALTWCIMGKLKQKFYYRNIFETSLNYLYHLSN